MRQLLQFLVVALLAGITACSERATPTPPPPSPAALAGPTLLAPPPLPTSVFVQATPDPALKISGVFVFAAGDGSLVLQDAAGGPPASLVERSTESIAQMPAFTRDGTHVVYTAMLFLPDGNLRADLRRTNLDGTMVETTLRAQANDEVFFYPRPAPDGRWLVTHIEGLQMEGERARLEWVDFATGSRMPVIEVARDGDVSTDSLFLSRQNRAAHSAPGSLWRVNLETRKFQQLTDIYDDSPIAAWSRDATQIAIHDFTGIRLIELPRQEIYPLFLEDGGTGGFDWYDGE